MESRVRIFLFAVAALFLMTHALALPPTLEDQDSINFAMGVESFDVPAHQPHPPGYPVYVALAKISTAALRVAAPSFDRDRRAAVGLAVWSVIAGTLAVFVFAAFWRAIGLDPMLAALAAAMTVTAPLFWFTAARPLSDVPALVAAVAVQTALLRAIAQRDAVATARWWLAAAFTAGLVIGLRSQTMWLIVPLVGALAIEFIRQGRWQYAAALIAAAAAGSLIWAVPMAIDSGGFGRYLEALSRQGAEDVQGVPMLALNPTWDLFAETTRRTFIVPWTARGLARVVSGLAVIGLVWMAVKRRSSLGLIALAYLPYLVFHYAAQDTVITRYSLPILVPVTGLAVSALGALHRYAAVIGAGAAIVTSLATVQPALTSYGRDGAPVFRAFQDMLRERTARDTGAELRMHHQVWWGVRRVRDWYRPLWDTGPQPFPGAREWLDIVARWTRGEQRLIWFLGDLTRTDLHLFDPRSRRVAGRYEMDDDVRGLMGGTRLEQLSWTVLTQPRWMLGTGWALTPETAGVAATDRAFPHQKAAEAHVRRGPEPLRMLIGGRFLGGPVPARIAVTLDGAPLDEWIVERDPNWFVRWIEVAKRHSGRQRALRSDAGSRHAGVASCR